MSHDKNSQMILAIPRWAAELYCPGVKHGTADSPIRTDFTSVHSVLRGYATWIQRGPAETDESYKQIIPYTVVHRFSDGARRRAEVLSYRRTRLSGEQRLADKRSIGFGGHVERTDSLLNSAVHALYETIERELYEELCIPALDQPLQTPVYLDEQRCFLLYDGTNAVGRVHLGIVCLVQLEGAGPVTARDQSVTDVEFLSTQELMDQAKDEQWESWSSLLIPTICSLLGGH